MAGRLSHSELQPKQTSTLMQRIMEFSMARLCLYFPQSVSNSICLSFSLFFFSFGLWLCECGFSLWFSQAHCLKLSQRMQKVFWGVKSLSNWALRVFRDVFLHLSAHCVFRFSCPESCLHRVGIMVSWWIWHREHMSLALSKHVNLWHPYMSCKPSLDNVCGTSTALCIIQLDTHRWEIINVNRHHPPSG